MITEFFLNLAAGFVGWLAGLFGNWQPPQMLLDMADTVGFIVGMFADLGVWVDWVVLGACVAAAVASWALVLGIKMVRALAAHIPAFGGSGD